MTEQNQYFVAEHAEPMFWVRLCSDGLYEGPIHHRRIEDVRKQSGAWSPLYLHVPHAPQQAGHIPTVEDIDAQDWAGMDGATAYQVIERHGEDWSHIGRLMAAWLAANQATGMQHPNAGDWLPIETAPKDGTAVLVMRDIWLGTESRRAEECNGHNTYVAAWWAGEGDDGNGRWVCYMDEVFDPTCPIAPTHWQPLPAAPGSDTQVTSTACSRGSNDK